MSDTEREIVDQLERNPKMDESGCVFFVKTLRASYREEIRVRGIERKIEILGGILFQLEEGAIKRSEAVNAIFDVFAVKEL